MPPRLRLALVLAVVLSAFAPSVSRAANQGAFGVRPPVVNAVAAPPHALPGATISNTTGDTIAVTVFPTLLSQALDGTLQTLERPVELDAAKRLLSVSDATFTLAPGREHVVHARWLDTLPGAKAAYLGIVFSGVPQRAASSGVTFNPRLVQINRLRRPGPFVSRGKLVGLRGEQAAPLRLRFFARVRNLGQVAEKPRRTSFVIHDAAGRPVFRTRWKTPFFVLPGADVEFPIDVAKVLPAGRYTAQALMRFGRNPALDKIETSFVLVGPNLLPTPALRLGPVTASGEPGGPAHVGVTVRNVGTAPLGGKLTLRLFPLGSLRPIAAASVATRVLKPKEDVVQTFSMGRVKVGLYRVEVVLGNGDRVFGRATQGFRVTAKKGFLTRYQSVIIALGGALLALLILLALLRGRRRRRALERELEEARRGS